MACTCVGPCTCSVDEVNSACPGTSCPIVNPILPPCDETVVEEVCPKVSVIDYKAGIAVSQSFNVPTCGETVLVTILEMPTIHVGAYFWSSVYGGFKIIAATEDTLTLLNECVDPISPAGTFVAAGSSFILIPDPTFLVAANQVFLAVDFTAPAVNTCVPAKFTSLTGIPVGSQVTFGGYSYWFVADLGGGIVQLCNMGAGAPAGQLFRATDFLGEFLYPVTVTTNSVILESAASLSGVLFNDDEPLKSIETSILVTNPYPDKNLSLYYSFIGSFSGEIWHTLVALGAFSPITLEIYVNGTLTFLKSLNHLYDVASPPAVTKSFQITGMETVVVVPGEELEIQGIMSLTWTGGAPITDSFVEGELSIRGNAFGVFPQ